jgi:hypothetical protein
LRFADPVKTREIRNRHALLKFPPRAQAQTPPRRLPSIIGGARRRERRVICSRS